MENFESIEYTAAALYDGGYGMKTFEIAYTFLDIGGTYHCLSYGKTAEEATRAFYHDGAGLHAHFLSIEEK